MSSFLIGKPLTLGLNKDNQQQQQHHQQHTIYEPHKLSNPIDSNVCSLSSNSLTHSHCSFPSSSSSSSISISQPLFASNVLSNDPSTTNNTNNNNTNNNNHHHHFHKYHKTEKPKQYLDASQFSSISPNSLLDECSSPVAVDTVDSSSIHCRHSMMEPIFIPTITSPTNSIDRMGNKEKKLEQCSNNSSINSSVSNNLTPKKSWFRSLFGSASAATGSNKCPPGRQPSSPLNNSTSKLNHNNSPSVFPQSMAPVESAASQRSQSNSDSSSQSSIISSSILRKISTSSTRSNISQWNSFSPKSNLDLANNLPPSSTLTSDGRHQLRLPIDTEHNLTPKCFTVRSRLGCMMFNKKSVCGYKRLTAEMEQYLVILLSQSSLGVSSKNSNQDKSKLLFFQTTNKDSPVPRQEESSESHQLQDYYESLSELIFGSMALKSDRQAPHDGSLIPLKLHCLGTVQHQNQPNELYISSFTMDIPKAKGFSTKYGFAILWLLSNSKIDPDETLPNQEQLTLEDLFFNHSQVVEHFVCEFRNEMFRSGVASPRDIHVAFQNLIQQFDQFVSALRLTDKLPENEFVDEFVHLIKLLDNKENSFFLSSLLSVLLSVGYKTNNLKLLLWSCDRGKIPTLVRLVTVLSHFRCKTLMVENFDQHKELCSSREDDFSNFAEIDYQFRTVQSPVQTCSNVPVSNAIAASGSNTTSSQKDQFGSRQLSLTNSACTVMPNEVTANKSLNDDFAKGGRKFFKSQKVRKSRDESIGYESLTDSSVSGNVSPVNCDTMGEEVKDRNLTKGFFTSADFSDSDLMNRLHLDSAFPDQYGRVGQVSNSISINRSNRSNRTFFNDSFDQHSKMSKSLSFFRGYLHLRCTGDGQPIDDCNVPSTIEEMEGTPGSDRFDTDLDSVSSQLTTEEDEAEGEVSQCANLSCGVQSKPISFQNQSSSSQLTHEDSSSETLVGHQQNSSTQSLECKSVLENICNDSNQQSTDTSNKLIESNKLAESRQEQMPFTKANHPTVSIERINPTTVSLSATNLFKATATTKDNFYKWTQNPVLTMQYLQTVLSQVIIDWQSSFESFRDRVVDEVQNSSDTVVVCNCDRWTIDYVEQSLHYSCPTISASVGALCESVAKLYEITKPSQNHLYQQQAQNQSLVYRYISTTIQSILYKSNVLHSLLLNDSECLLNWDNNEKNNVQDVHCLRASLLEELIEPNPKRNHCTSQTTATSTSTTHTSHLYLFQDHYLMECFQPNVSFWNTIGLDLSDLPVIIGLRKQLCMSKLYKERLVENNNGIIRKFLLSGNCFDNGEEKRKTTQMKAANASKANDSSWFDQQIRIQFNRIQQNKWSRELYTNRYASSDV